MKVTVTSPTDVTYVVDIDSKNTVWDLKEKLSKLEGFPKQPQRMELLHNTRLLFNKNELNALNIPGSPIVALENVAILDNRTNRRFVFKWSPPKEDDLSNENQEIRFLMPVPATARERCFDKYKQRVMQLSIAKKIKFRPKFEGLLSVSAKAKLWYLQSRRSLRMSPSSTWYLQRLGFNKLESSYALALNDNDVDKAFEYLANEILTPFPSKKGRRFGANGFRSVTNLHDGRIKWKNSFLKSWKVDHCKYKTHPKVNELLGLRKIFFDFSNGSLVSETEITNIIREEAKLITQTPAVNSGRSYTRLRSGNRNPAGRTLCNQNHIMVNVSRKTTNTVPRNNLSDREVPSTAGNQDATIGTGLDHSIRNSQGTQMEKNTESSRKQKKGDAARKARERPAEKKKLKEKQRHNQVHKPNDLHIDTTVAWKNSTKQRSKRVKSQTTQLNISLNLSVHNSRSSLHLKKRYSRQKCSLSKEKRTSAKTKTLTKKRKETQIAQADREHKCESVANQEYSPNTLDDTLLKDKRLSEHFPLTRVSTVAQSLMKQTRTPLRKCESLTQNDYIPNDSTNTCKSSSSLDNLPLVDSLLLMGVLKENESSSSTSELTRCQPYRNLAERIRLQASATENALPNSIMHTGTADATVPVTIVGDVHFHQHKHSHRHKHVHGDIEHGVKSDKLSKDKRLQNYKQTHKCRQKSSELKGKAIKNRSFHERTPKTKFTTIHEPNHSHPSTVLRSSSEVFGYGTRGNRTLKAKNVDKASSKNAILWKDSPLSMTHELTKSIGSLDLQSDYLASIGTSEPNHCSYQINSNNIIAYYVQTNSSLRGKPFSHSPTEHKRYPTEVLFDGIRNWKHALTQTDGPNGGDATPLIHDLLQGSKNFKDKSVVCQANKDISFLKPPKDKSVESRKKCEPENIKIKTSHSRTQPQQSSTLYQDLKKFVHDYIRQNSSKSRKRLSQESIRLCSTSLSDKPSNKVLKNMDLELFIHKFTSIGFMEQDVRRVALDCACDRNKTINQLIDNLTMDIEIPNEINPKRPLEFLLKNHKFVIMRNIIHVYSYWLSKLLNKFLPPGSAVLKLVTKNEHAFVHLLCAHANYRSHNSADRS